MVITPTHKISSNDIQIYYLPNLMEYTNPEIPEGINTTAVHPLKDFIILTLGTLGFIAIIVVILGLLAEILAVYIPFSAELDLIPEQMILDHESSETEKYLQSVSDQLSVHMDLPEDMQFTVLYSDSQVQNAYATLGGHIYIFQGLLNLLPDENALAMVIAHEMAHIYHRHPIIAMGRGVVIGLLLTTVSGVSGDYFVGKVVTDTGLITLLKFNRDQERQADKTALEMLVKKYGHIQGADELFRLLQTQKNINVNPPLFLSTHPFSDERIVKIREYAIDNGWALEGELTALPDFLSAKK